jgi:hypothetical protein
MKLSKRKKQIIDELNEEPGAIYRAYLLCFMLLLILVLISQLFL